MTLDIFKILTTLQVEEPDVMLAHSPSVESTQTKTDDVTSNDALTSDAIVAKPEKVFN